MRISLPLELTLGLDLGLLELGGVGRDGGVGVATGRDGLLGAADDEPRDPVLTTPVESWRL